MTADAIKTLLAENVLQTAGIFGGSFGAHAQADEPVGNQCMALKHLFGLRKPLGGEQQKAAQAANTAKSLFIGVFGFIRVIDCFCE